ncbi:hypothetical protein SAMN03159343_0258 [Klenkia marina]|uniref:Uncharacterized protein n=1 Tax=Klenkia marina TaxID=1960309 RepID=A0A1G4X9T3_9ACTN|nr:hypothetical protein [Klenkia marina]SCX37983.1 hypothetical protein SAMN03159343_0258 [Klenkia marina]
MSDQMALFGRDPSPVLIEVGRRTAWLRGKGLLRALDDAGIPRMRCPIRKQWCCPTNRVDDLLAILEHRNRRLVEVVAVDR